MLPDLSPHLHTHECNALIREFNQCIDNNSFFSKMADPCAYWYEAVWQCTKAERIYRRDTNPKYGKRVLEAQHLPFERWTPALKNLAEDGKLEKPKPVADCVTCKATDAAGGR